MAVTKLWSVTERLGQVIDYATNPEKTSAKIKREFSPEQYQALADVIAYAKDEEKTEREFYVEGINCNVAIARDQFITVKEQYQKTDGIQAYHGYLSFKETDISPEMAQKIGMEFGDFRDKLIEQLKGTFGKYYDYHRRDIAANEVDYLNVEDPDVFSHRAWELEYQRKQEMRRNQPARTKKKSYDMEL